MSRLTENAKITSVYTYNQQQKLTISRLVNMPLSSLSRSHQHIKAGTKHEFWSYQLLITGTDNHSAPLYPI